jgi:hypothetical protein
VSGYVGRHLVWRALRFVGAILLGVMILFGGTIYMFRDALSVAVGLVILVAIINILTAGRRKP